MLTFQSPAYGWRLKGVIEYGLAMRPRWVTLRVAISLEGAETRDEGDSVKETLEI